MLTKGTASTCFAKWFSSTMLTKGTSYSFIIILLRSFRPVSFTHSNGYKVYVHTNEKIIEHPQLVSFRIGKIMNFTLFLLLFFIKTLVCGYSSEDSRFLSSKT